MPHRTFRCPNCRTAGDAKYFVHHMLVAHPEAPMPCGLVGEVMPRSTGAGACELINRSGAKPRSAEIPEKARAHAKGQSKPRRQQAVRKRSDRTIVRADFSNANGQCFLCGKKIVPGHMLMHANHLLRARSRERPLSIERSPSGSVWTVSGGLPSLGKRNR
jgi:hypothetical protein